MKQTWKNEVILDITLDFQFREQGKAGYKGGKEAQNIWQPLFSICRPVKIKSYSDNQADETHFYSADQDH